MDESMDLNDACRLCLSKKDKNLHIFAESDPGEDTLISKIRACVGVQVLRGDGLSKRICLQCHCHINLWYYFKQDCARSQTKLKSWHCNATRTNESHSEMDEVIHIKQEPPDFANESFRDRTLDDLPNGALQNSHGSSSIGGGLDGHNDCIDENEDEDMENSNSMNLIIMDATSIPTDNLTCQNAMGSTVIELQPEDEDLLRTVVESDEGLRNPDEEEGENEVTIVQVGKEDSAGVDMMEEITLDEDSSHSSAVEEALEEDLESPAEGVSFQATRTVTGGCSVQLVRVKEEKDDWTWPTNTSPTRKQVVATPSTSLQGTTSSPAATPLMWKCPKCPRSFSSSKTKNIHLAKSHKDKNENGPVQREPVLRTTLPKIINSLYDEELMLCKICDKRYPTDYYLWRHLRSCHEEHKPFACQVCRRIFKTKRELTSHRLRTISKHCRLGKTGPPVDASKMCVINMKIPNNVIGRYTCKECSAPFKCFSLVKKHFTIHTGELPYECPKCKREYREYKTASLHFKVCNAPLPVYKYAPNFNPKAPRAAGATGATCATAAPGATGTPGATGVPCAAGAPGATAATAATGAKGKQSAGFKCPKCPRVFNIYSTYWKHKKRGCEQKRFCVNCSQSIVVQEWESHAANCVPPNDKSPYPRKRVERTSLTLQDILDIHKTVDGQDPQELKCKVCSNVFGSLKSLKAHIRKHSALPLKCTICNLTVQHESTLRNHMQSYHGEVSYATSSVKLTNPLVAKHKARLGGFTSSKLKCDQCHKLFSSMSALQFHKRTHKVQRSDAPRLTCPVCKKVFMTTNALSNHKKVHASIQLKLKMYKCTYCDNCYSDANELHLHKMSVHQEGELPAASNSASSAIAPDENSTKDEAEYKSPPKPSFKCDTCGKRYTAESSLIRHKKLHEASQDINKYRCETCNKSFVTSKSFDSHKGWHSRSSSTLPPIKPKIALHPKVKSQKFYCPVCGKVFLHKANAKRHMIMQNHNYKGPPLTAPVLNPVVPVEKTEYKCKQCPNTFSGLKAYKGHLQEHKSETGGGASTAETTEEGPLVCKLCKKTLRSVKGYKKHLLGHSNQKPFKCDVCSNQYSSETALTKHKQAHEFKAFACNKCKACFSEKEELISHYENCNA